MVNKKGYVKTLEAVIAIVGILMFTFGVMPREIVDTSREPFIVENSQNFIVEVLQDPPYRDYVINISEEGGKLDQTHYSYIAANNTINSLISSNVPPTYDYEFKICLTTTCLAENPPSDVSVYSNDVILAGTVEGEPKVRIVRLWFWPKGG